MKVVRRVAQGVSAAALSMAVTLSVYAEVRLPNVGGSGADLESTIQSKSALALQILALVIGLGVLAAIGFGALNYTQRRWREGHNYMLGAAAGAIVGTAMYAIAQALTSN